MGSVLGQYAFYETPPVGSPKPRVWRPLPAGGQGSKEGGESQEATLRHQGSGGPSEGQVGARKRRPGWRPGHLKASKAAAQTLGSTI